MEITIIGTIAWILYFISLYILVYWFIYFVEKKVLIKQDVDQKKPKLTRFPFVSIAVPAYNEEKHVIKTLNSLLHLEYPDDKYELIVINDCSTDKTKAMVENFISRYKKIGKRAVPIQLINNPVNRGKAESLNIALASAKGEFFAGIDADSRVESDALVYMIDMFNKDPELSIATPIMKIETPTTWIQKFQRLEYMSSMLIIKLMGYMDCNYVAPGPFSLYKRSVLKKLGGFDGTHNIEDQEIVWRAQKKHLKIRQSSKTFVYTIGPATLKSLTRQRTRWYRGSIMTLYDYKDMTFNKKYGDFGMFQIPLIIMSYLLSVTGLFLFFYITVKAIVQQIANWFLINFDLLVELRNIHFNFNILDANVTQILVIYLSLMIAVVLIYYASRATQDRVRKYGSLYIVPFFLVYYILLSLILTKTLFEIATKKKQEW